MAEIAGIASFTKDGYRQLPCPLCRHWLKINIFPHTTKSNKTYKCINCKAKLMLDVIEEDERDCNGDIRINISATTAVKQKNGIMLKKKN